MPFTPYRLMTVEQATAALEEFLTERPAALEHLRAELTAHGMEPGKLLDTSPASLTPLWHWITGRRTELAADPALEVPVLPRERWPSWARHSVTGVRAPSATMDLLLDGLVSYLATVILTRAPNARWALGSPEDPRHHLHHHPVLIGRCHQVYVPTLPLGGVLRLKRGERSLHATELEQYAHSVITDLRISPHTVDGPQDCPLDVVAGPESFDVGLHAGIAERSPHLVDRMAEELADLDGVISVLRSAPDALQIHAPDWDADELEQWLLTWMKANGPFIR